MPQTKKQKQEKVLSKLELELKELTETWNRWNRWKHEQGAYDSYIVPPPARYYYVENQVNILRQKLGLKRYFECPKCKAARYGTAGRCDCCGTTTMEVWR